LQSVCAPQALPLTKQPKVLVPVCVAGGSLESSFYGMFSFLQLAKMSVT